MLEMACERAAIAFVQCPFNGITFAVLNKQEVKDAYEHWFRPLMHIAVLITGREDLAFEAVQEVFASLLQNPREILNTKAYLFQAVKNRALNELKKQKTVQELDALLEHESNDDPLRDLEFTETQMQMLELIRLMPPRRRSIFLLHREAGLKYREIADLLNISVKTVENQMLLALQMLRKNFHSD